MQLGLERLYFPKWFKCPSYIFKCTESNTVKKAQLRRHTETSGEAQPFVLDVCSAPLPTSSNINCHPGVRRTHALSTITLSHFLFFSSIFSDAQQPAVSGQWLLKWGLAACLWVCVSFCKELWSIQNNPPPSAQLLPVRLALIPAVSIPIRAPDK